MVGPCVRSSGGDKGQDVRLMLAKRTEGEDEVKERVDWCYGECYLARQTRELGRSRTRIHVMR